VKTPVYSVVTAPPDPAVDGIDNELRLRSGQVNALQAGVLNGTHLEEPTITGDLMA
jgi:hypothetical protein